MHEISIIHNILDSVRKGIAYKKVSNVIKIYVTIGILSGISKEALLSSYALIPKDKLFNKTKLIINNQQIEIYCNTCEAKTIITEGFGITCSKCHKPCSNIIRGKELSIDKIEVDYEAKNNRNTKRYIGEK